MLEYAIDNGAIRDIGPLLPLTNNLIFKGDKVMAKPSVAQSTIKNQFKKTPIIHGLSGHPLYKKWKSMKNRCFNPNAKVYPYYGKRGITICNEWLEDFRVFYEWAMSNGWKPGLILDRINVDGEYSPVNCRFIDNGLNNRNKRLLTVSNKSGYRGVHFHKRQQRWIATINIDGKTFTLGSFKKPIDAAHAYDAKAKELNAEHPLNFPNEV